MATPIEQLEAAGVIDTSNLSNEVRDAINKRTTQDMVDSLIAFHKTVGEEHVAMGAMALSDGDEENGGMF